MTRQPEGPVVRVAADADGQTTVEVEGPITVREFYGAMADVDRRFGRLEKFVLFLAVAVGLPKVSSLPEPSQVVGWVVGW